MECINKKCAWNRKRFPGNCVVGYQGKCGFELKIMRRKVKSMRIFFIIVLLIGLSGCTSGAIKQNITTIDPAGNTVIDHCEGSYTSLWGSSETKGVHGCNAGGESKGSDQTAMTDLLIRLLTVGAK
jgi:hypothetical protein